MKYSYENHFRNHKKVQLIKFTFEETFLSAFYGVKISIVPLLEEFKKNLKSKIF